MNLEPYGWSSRLAALFEPHGAEGMLPGRVVLERRDQYRVVTPEGEMEALASGRLRHHASGPGDLPTIGDWVALEPISGSGPARIRAVLPRHSQFSRKVAGTKTAEQVVAANVDRLFVVVGLDGDFSLRRIERYLIAAWEGGADPVVILNKADLHDSPESVLQEVETVAGTVPVLLLSCRDGTGLDSLEAFLQPGVTIALVGSSGVGKSTLINRLHGEEIMRTAEVRERDDRGQHTTSHRELFLLRSGALLIDNPGIRELQLWAADDSLEAAFGDVEALAVACRFRDCRHEGEPGCAVREAVEAGHLDEGRLESYHQMQRELEHLERRRDESAALQEKRKWRSIHRAARKHKPRSM